MKKIRYIVLGIFLATLIFIKGYAEEQPQYYLSFYLNSSNIYPGDKIPLTLNLSYYYLDREGNFQEDVTMKIYKIPSDLSQNKYEEYCKQNEPLKEITREVTMEMSGGRYWYGYLNFELPTMDSGNYYITASSDKAKYQLPLRLSKIAMSAKSTTDRIILFVQDKKSGKSLENIDVSLQLQQEKKEYKTDKDGIVSIYSQDLKDFKSGNSFRFIAVRGEDSAEINLSVPGIQEIFKGYIYTDRPVYRPEQKVNFKGILRIEKGDSLEYAGNKEMNVRIMDSQNTEVYKKTLKTDEYGSIKGDFTLSAEPHLGIYYIYCTHPNGQQATGYFQVEEYRKPEFEVKINTEKEQYIQGQTITYNVEANYYFGAPVPNKEFSYEVYRNYYYPYYWNYWWEEDCRPSYYNNNSYSGEFITSGNSKTDKEGKASFTCEASKVDYDSTYMVKVRMVDESRREVTGSTSIKVTRGAFYMTITPEKYYYGPNDKVHIKVLAKDYKEKPVKTDLNMKIKYERYDKKKNTWEWQDYEKVQLKTDENGLTYYDYTTKDEGYYEIECTAEDQNKNEIKTTGYFYCYAGGNYNWYRFSNVEIISDKNYYEIGDTGNFLIVCPFEGVKGLVTVEGENIYTQEVMDFSNKAGSLKVNITEKHSPNFYITVSFFYQNVFYYKTQKVVCPSKDKFLTLSIDTDKEKYKPRDTAKFTIKTLDSNNKPVSSQVTMGVADESVYAVVSETTPNIQKFFYGLRNNMTYTYGSDGAVYGGYYNHYRGEYDRDGICEEKSKLQKEEMPSGVLGNSKSPEPAPVLVKPDFTREFFPDTAYFNPDIITDENGIAEVNFRMPDTLTTWRATARGVSKDTKVGENTKKVIVSKDLLARLIMPRFFTERDEAVITGIVHNYLNSEKTVYAKLEIDGGIELIENAQYKSKVGPDGSVTINWKVKVKKAGEYKVTLTALTDEESDAVQLKIPVLPHGTEKYVALGGSTFDKAEEEITLPKEAEQGSARCIILLDPSIASTVLTSLDYLIGYPYGCVEQTMSRFLPNVVVAKTLGELDIYDEKINKELPKMVKEGFTRLYNFHHGDGGWGWWENDESHPYMTAYVVYGLTLAKEAGYSIDEGKMRAGLEWMKGRYSSEKDINTKAYMAFSATVAGENTKYWLLELYKNREELDNYSKAVIALSLYKLNLEKEAKDMVNLLETTVDASGTTACWNGKTGGHGWTDNQIETTSYCLKALLSISPESKLIPKVIRFLSGSRRGNCWYSTKDTAAAVMSLTEYIKISKEMNPDFSADVYFNDTKIKSLTFKKEDVGKPGQKIEIPFDQGLKEGKNKVRLEMNGKGVLYYAVYLKYYTDEENVKSADSGFKVVRTYYLMKPGETDEKKSRIKLGSNGEFKLNSQDIILVEISVTGISDYEYVIIEDPKPAGCEYDTEQRQNATEWNYWYSHREMRDEKIAYFCTYYWKGEQKATYRLRAETPGTFHVMPTRSYLMYSPEAGGNSDEVIIKIKEDKKESNNPQLTPVGEGEVTSVKENQENTNNQQGSSRKMFIVGGIGVAGILGIGGLIFFKLSRGA